MERSNEEKTSAVHFLRFELTSAMREAWHRDGTVVLRSTHPEARLEATLEPAQRKALAADFVSD